MTAIKNTPEKYEIRIPTPDDWYPTHDDGTVRVFFTAFLDGSGWRVGAWGSDDFGLERDFTTRADAIELYRRLSKMAVITQRDLLDMGFVRG